MTWQEEKKSILEKAKIIVVKIGSAVIASQDSLNQESINSLARQLSQLAHIRGKKLIVVSSGAVAAGKAILKKKNIIRFPNYAVAKHAIAAIGQSLLMQAWNNAFAPYGINCGQVLLTREDLRSRQRFQMASSTFANMLDWNVIPIVNENDTVSSSDLKFGDNDCLASLLVNLTEAELFINLTSAPGVFNANPDIEPGASIMDCISNIGQLDIENLCGSRTNLGSGGMDSKLLAARRVAQLGVPTLIVPGKVQDVIDRVFSDDEIPIGTWVSPQEATIPRRKFWLAYQSEPAGKVEIDAGAAKALLYEGRSLLPGGVCKVDGNFDKGALLRVTHKDQVLGVGFSNYSSRELEKIHGLKRHEIAAILGLARYPDVIHRDNMLLDAAI